MTCSPLRADFLGQALVLHHVDVGDGGGAGDRVAAEGGEVLAGAQAVGDLRAGDGGAEREAVGDPLGQHHDVRLDAEVLDGEHLAGAAEAGLHLVGDEEDAVAVEDFLDALEVAGRRHQDAALAHHRLGDEGGDIAARLVVDGPLDHLGAALGHHFRIVGAEGVAIDVRRWGEGDAGQVGAAARLARLVAGDGEGARRAAVEGVGEGDELPLAGVRLGQAHGRLDALGAGVAEEGLLQAARRDLGQLLGQLGHDRHVIDVGRGVDDLVHLRLGGGDHARVAVPGVDDGDAGEAVDVLRAVLVPDGRALGLGRRRSARWRRRTRW